jgi:hypothetical protein
MEATLKTFAAVLALLMIPTASFAETRAHTTQTAAPVAATGDWSASKMHNVGVYNEANGKIGEISDLIITAPGQVTGVVLEVGNFLKTRTRHVLVAMNSLKFSNDAGKTSAGKTSETKKEWSPDRAILNVTKDELKAMPEFKD